MSDYIYFMNLNSSPKEWATFMYKMYNQFDRKKASNKISSLGFNIETETKKLEELL